MALSPGTRLGPYEIAAQIGAGGMGEVYRATDTKLKRQVAIKVLPEAVAGDPERLARFQREAEVLASLNHPNIAAIYGLEEADSTKALVMELVEGPALADRIAQGPIPVDEALPIAKQIAEALEAAHERGIIHRDLKPANIKIRPDGTAKVLDFGLAKAMEPAMGSSPSLSQSPTITTPAMTHAGMILGTAAYMSPEQARGKPVDKRTDVWAFGCVLFEMLTGQRAFDGEDVTETLAAVVKSEPEWDRVPTALAPSIRAFLTRCLAKNPKQRIADVQVVRLALEGAFDADGVGVLTDASRASVRPPTDVVPPKARSRLPWIAAGLLTVATGLAVWSLKPETPGQVIRFSYVLPEGQQFPAFGRVMVALSPDGSSMAYVANGQVHTRSMDAVASHPLPGLDDDGPTGVFFSPDGQWIGYWSVRDRQMKKIAVSGGAPVALCDAEPPFGVPSWGADDTIVWAENQGIMRVSANGGTPELLTAQRDAGVYGAPTLLPGNQSVLYSVGSGQPEIVIESLASGERTTLLAGVHPRYVSTGHLVYGLGDVLFAVPFDLDALEVLGGAVPLVEGVRTDAFQYAVSDSGALAYIAGTASVNDDRRLGLVDRNGSVEPLDVPPNAYLSPRVSPGGTALVVQTDTVEPEVWVYDLSGGSQIRLLTEEGSNRHPIWTPDGERVTYASDRDGTWGIYWQRADGTGAAERLVGADTRTEYYPESWSPDGRTLLFSIRSGADWDLWTLSLDNDGEAEKFYDAPRLQFSGDFSASGRWIAYLDDQAGVPALYVQPFPPTGERHRITAGAMPMWSRDGRELFYRTEIQNIAAAVGAADRGSGVRLWAIDMSLDPAPRWTNARALPIEGFTAFNAYRDYDIMPDGERFVMVFPSDQPESPAEGPSRDQINVVLNWTEELKRLVPVP